MRRRVNHSRSRGSTLTASEIRVLRAIVNQGDRLSVGETLGISHQTVKSHLQHIYAKLGVSDGNRAVAIALAIGIIKPDEVVGGEVSLTDLRIANLPWLSISEQEALMESVGIDHVKAFSSIATRGRRGFIELNGLCGVRLDNVNVQTEQVERGDRQRMTIIGRMVGINPTLRRHLDRPWVSRAAIEGTTCRTGHRVSTDVTVDTGGSNNGVNRYLLTLTWVEKNGEPV